MELQQLLTDIINEPSKSLLVILNLVLIESLLSIDNAAVLATMVMHLPVEQRKKALKYGIFGAYIFRGLCLVFASYLIKIWWLKAVGGFYLLFLSIRYFIQNKKNKKEDHLDVKDKSWIYKNTLGLLGPLWSTILLVEIMDLAFSVDNVFAAVAFTPNILLICIGVFIGILAMRFVAQRFIKLMEKYFFLEPAAFVIIFILGLKLSVSLWTHFNPNTHATEFMDSPSFDLFISVFTVLIFIVPIITFNFLGWPKKKFS
jgi:YkoY family integral membrane protein